MAIDKENYITAGELASLYGIPKQTLLYYDKSGLLVPAFVNEHGYRYYSVSQYLVLEIILNMRKLNIPIQDIKNYLHNRSPENFEQILQEKEKECNRIMEETAKIKNSLQLSLKSIEKIRKTRLNQIQINFQKEKILFVSENLSGSISLRERMQILSRHNQKAFSKEHFKEFTTGWIIGKEEFFAEKFNKTLHFFTPVAHTIPREHCFVRPEGLYVTIRFQGTYYQKIPFIYKEILDFVQRNRLEVLSNVYVFPLKNHWLTEDTETYINQVSFQVEYPS
ncbi:MAG TPA: MerR family transcriptional regulator [Methylomusa anaerophila]|uniref:Multidrug-efflux transporter 1 regulator n=1 Tax=Methylomusa anaerophila TaxID=1930071 RepID=A0A348AL85_9FIRM|nr:MerR family transcriptional regulator [Methylomusa anaerophila]BBB91833.1 multidrug-efflux transporter 1 regulator [Methylomusa anaerophila]HML88434.1 MerR family transcriptional regulator [Methylomusa anaerophila]